MKRIEEEVLELWLILKVNKNGGELTPNQIRIPGL